MKNKNVKIPEYKKIYNKPRYKIIQVYTLTLTENNKTVIT